MPRSECYASANADADAIAGPIPAELANIPQLTDLDLAENRIEGMHEYDIVSFDVMKLMTELR